MSEWQPIETAPKDGTLIDLWGRRKPHRMMEHLAEPFCRLTDCRWALGPSGSILQIKPAWICGDRVVEEATHWMLPPAPPETSPQE